MPSELAAAREAVASSPRERLAARRDLGEGDGTRTHDHRDHNPGLYQLSYALRA